MADLVEKVLGERGPLLSSDLARILTEECGLTPAAARKQISRTGSNVKRLAYLTFPRNARFTYLQKDYGSPWFWESLIQALQNNSTSYGGALAAIRQRGGLMPKRHFEIACGSPIAQLRHLSPDVVLQRLTTAKLVEEVDVSGIGACVALAQLPGFYDQIIAEMRARLVTEGILLNAIRVWIRNLGLGSYDKVAVRDTPGSALPKIGTFLWDLSAPSYLGPMMEWAPTGKPKPGFIACDVLLGIEMTGLGLKPFLQKCITLRSLKRVGKCLQIFVADSYDKAAFGLAKERGIVPATPETLFGREVAEALTQLADVLGQAALSAANPSVINELFDRLGRIEGAATNLRGALFEFIVAELVRQKYGATVVLNRIFKNETGQQAEVDVVGEQGSQIVHFIECKGYQPSGTLEDEEVRRWLEIRIPLVRKEALKHPDWKRCRLNFELWVTGKISGAATQMIENAKALVRRSKYTLDYRDAERVHAVGREVNDPAVLHALRKHFLEHPLATAERHVTRKAKRKGPIAGQHQVRGSI